MESEQIVIQPMPPFNFDNTVYVPHYFPRPDFEWQPNVMRAPLYFFCRLGLLAVLLS